VSGFWELFRKDVRIELRTREILSATGLMSLVTLVLVSFAIGLNAAVVREVAPGLLWVLLAFSSAIGLGRSFQMERELGAGLAVLAAPVDRMAILLAKSASNWLWILAVQAFTLPLFAVLLNLDVHRHIGPLSVVVLLGTAGLSIVGTLFAAMTSVVRLREAMLPIVLFPIAMPLLIACVGATRTILAGDALSLASPELRLLGAFDIILGASSLVLFETVVEEGL
jgi:heme exporter protein B